MILQSIPKRFFLVIIFISLLCGINACGKKPNSLEPPNADKSTYPQTYPTKDKIPGNGPQFSDK